MSDCQSFGSFPYFLAIHEVAPSVSVRWVEHHHVERIVFKWKVGEIGYYIRLYFYDSCLTPVLGVSVSERLSTNKARGLYLSNQNILLPQQASNISFPFSIKLFLLISSISTFSILCKVLQYFSRLCNLHRIPDKFLLVSLCAY